MAWLTSKSFNDFQASLCHFQASLCHFRASLCHFQASFCDFWISLCDFWSSFCDFQVSPREFYASDWRSDFGRRAQSRVSIGSHFFLPRITRINLSHPQQSASIHSTRTLIISCLPNGRLHILLGEASLKHKPTSQSSSRCQSPSFHRCRACCASKPMMPGSFAIRCRTVCAC